MSTSSGVNVLRWSALAFGVFYGFSHQRTITATQKAAHEHKQYSDKQKLIDQAKAEYAKSKAPKAESTSQGASPLDQDPMSANFNLESYLQALAEKYP